MPHENLILKCDNCGGEFIPKRIKRDNRFCGARCRAEFHNVLNAKRLIMDGLDAQDERRSGNERRKKSRAV
jgi:predicted nucleic acid-binding Zn ribbon protein